MKLFHPTKLNGARELPAPALPLKQLLWQSYLRTALIPLLVIELSFLLTYWISATIVYNQNVEAVSDLSKRYFQDIAHREAGTISTRFESVSTHTRVFASQALNALEGDFVPPVEERARYAMTDDGVLYTTRGNGTTASIYSNRTKIGRAEMEKVWRLSALDPFMKAVVESNPIVASVYFNTHDSYNRIYPFLNVLEQYPRDIDIPSYNFYYKADATHNPQRRDVWTDAYVDPAGHGWMVSSIAPVWRGDRLEGVVGIDVTLETLIDSLLNLNLPWGGYAILVDDKGGIIALPPAGEKDFGLTEQTSYHYEEAIQSDTFKPETFNVFRREDTRALAAALRRSSEGNVELQLGGSRMASFDTVPQTGWKLVIIAPTDRILADARELNSRLKTIGLVMVAALLVFYLLFFVFLLLRARRMSDLIAQPLTQIAVLIDTIGQRDADPRFLGSQIQELDKLGRQLVVAERRLIEAEVKSREQSIIAQEALAQLREANAEMVRFTRQMSHQIRTPLAIIDGSAQIIQRKGSLLEPENLSQRADRLRKAVKSIGDILTKMVDRFDALSGQFPVERRESVDLGSQVAAIARELIPAKALELHVSSAGPKRVEGWNALLGAFREVVAKALRFSEEDGVIRVHFEAKDHQLTVAVSNVSSHPGSFNKYDLINSQNKVKQEHVPDLGLSIARQAVDNYDGTLSVVSIGRINTVTITFPISHEMARENG